MLRSKSSFPYTLISLGLDTWFEGGANGCTQAKLGTQCFAGFYMCPKMWKRRKSSHENISGHGCSLSCPSFIEIYCILRQLLELWNELMFKCSAGPMEERSIFSCKKSTARTVLLLRKRYRLKIIMETKLTGGCPFKKKQTFVIFFMIQEVLYDNSESSCPTPLCSWGVVPHPAIRSCCTWAGVRVTQWLSCKQSLASWAT